MGLDIQQLRRRIVEVAYKSQEGHVPSALSCLSIIADLYDRVLTPDDRFCLSKGHAALALYAVLEAKGILPAGMLDTFCQEGSPLKGHPTIGIPGITCSTGSLGTGITFATGIAYALKLKGSEGRVYCLCGDGEFAEGSCWEACMIANRLGLQNFHIIVDANDSWMNFEDLEWFIRRWGNLKIIRTTKGEGILRMELDPQRYHHAKLTEQEYREILEELS